MLSVYVPKGGKKFLNKNDQASSLPDLEASAWDGEEGWESHRGTRPEARDKKWGTQRW